MNTYRYITLAAMALTFAACSQDEDFDPQNDSDAVRINATIGILPQTRLAYGDEDVNNEEATTFTEGDQIRVQNTKRTTKNIATYKLDADGKTWTIADGALVWNGSSTNQFQAWYPAYKNASYDSFELPTDQSNDALLAAADWMTASTNEMAKPTDGTIKLAFQHQLTKVTIKVTTWNSEFSENNKTITDPIIWSTGSYIEISYGTGTDGADEYTSDGSPTAINPVVSGETFTARHGGYVLSAVSEYQGLRPATISRGQSPLPLLPRITYPRGRNNYRYCKDQPVPPHLQCGVDESGIFSLRSTTRVIPIIRKV